MFELRPGEELRANAKGFISKPFWNPIDASRNHSQSQPSVSSLRHTLLNVLSDSLPEQTGVYIDLSGGLDSSTLAAGIAAIRDRFDHVIAATVVHKSVGAANELQYARTVATTLNVPLLEINGEEHLPFSNGYSGAIARHKPIPQVLHRALHEAHSNLAEEHGCTTFVNGYGGDQLFQSQSHLPLHLSDHLIAGSYRLFWEELQHWCRNLSLPYLRVAASAILGAVRKYEGNQCRYLGRL